MEVTTINRSLCRVVLASATMVVADGRFLGWKVLSSRRLRESDKRSLFLCGEMGSNLLRTRSNDRVVHPTLGFKLMGRAGVEMVDPQWQTRAPVSESFHI